MLERKPKAQTAQELKASSLPEMPWAAGPQTRWLEDLHKVLASAMAIWHLVTTLVMASLWKWIVTTRFFVGSGYFSCRQ
jgi:hypothetical protein